MDRKEGKARRLTPDERERIVTLRLSGVSIREVAKQIPTTTATVQAVFRAYMEERSAQFASEVELERAKILSRLERIANDAAFLALSAEKEGDRTRAMAEERQALAQMAKLLGIDVQRVEHSGEAGFTVLRIVETVDGETGEQ